ncbi:MAG: lytic transglycosylase domain-containing protein [Pseudomonadota bacterium]|nr:lytic transglycosylase domain-containing protein [Pseudomonadota bacterium]
MRRGLDKTFNIGIVGLLLAAAIATLAPAARAVPVPITARETAHPTIAAPRIRPTHFAQDACGIIETESALRNIPAPFIARLIWTESRFNPVAVSPKGAQGIAQFMPGTAALRELADPFEPATALAASIRYLAELRGRFGNLGLAAAAYNAGEQRVENLIAGKGSMPLETEDYVLKITGRPIADWRGAADRLPEPLDKALPFSTACKNMVATRKLPTVHVQVALSSAPRQPWGAQVFESFSRAQAVNFFHNLQKRHPAIFGAGPPLVVPVVNYSLGRRTRHAVFVGAPTRAAADRKCAAMRKSGVACLVLSTGL